MSDADHRRTWLADVRVVDLTDSLAGCYAGRLLHDAGAQVLRCTSVATRVDLAVAGGSAVGADALVQILQDGVVSLDERAMRAALGTADIVLCNASTWSSFALDDLTHERPAATVVAI
ncbi:MAG TPA: CoA transferase, partial [Ilumatobacteraceae bacterium]